MFRRKNKFFIFIEKRCLTFIPFLNNFKIINGCLEFIVAYILGRFDSSVPSCRRFCYYQEYKRNMRGGGLKCYTLSLCFPGIFRAAFLLPGKAHLLTRRSLVTCICISQVEGEF